VSELLPPIDARALPADIRAGSAADRTRYETALHFERELVAQLTQQLADSAKGDEQDTTSAATTDYQQVLPGVLADSVMQSGGLGLARQIAINLKESGR
jgi:Rod binding domain-containing protein